MLLCVVIYILLLDIITVGSEAVVLLLSRGDGFWGCKYGCEYIDFIIFL